MVSGFICGTSKLPKEEDDDYVRYTRSADSSPRRSRTKNLNKNNPYSTRGLDKFSSLLAMIEEKRKQIYSQVVNPDEISFVRFEYFGDNDFKPIVVKSKHKDNDVETTTTTTTIKEMKSFKREDENTSKIINKLEPLKSMNNKEEEGIKVNNEVISKKVKNMGCQIKLSTKQQWRESLFVLPMIIVLILVFLVLFGKSFAIMCTSIGWYVIPTITNKTANSSSSSSPKLKTSFKKKDYAIRRLSEKKLMTSSEGAKSFKNN